MFYILSVCQLLNNRCRVCSRFVTTIPVGHTFYKQAQPTEPIINNDENMNYSNVSFKVYN